VSGRWAGAATAALGVAVLLAGAVLVRMVLDDPGARGSGRTVSAAAASSVVASDEARSGAVTAGSRAAERVLGYSWRTLEEDAPTTRALLTGQMVEQYDDTVARLSGRARARHTMVRADVAAASAVSVTADEATVLLFVNRRTTGRDLDRPRVELDRIVLTLRRSDGDWLVSELDVL
jgi:Mce-associated membrane protein